MTQHRGRIRAERSARGGVCSPHPLLGVQHDQRVWQAFENGCVGSAEAFQLRRLLRGQPRLSIRFAGKPSGAYRQHARNGGECRDDRQEPEDQPVIQSCSL